MAVDGAAWIATTATTLLDTAINEALERFSEETMCLFDDNISFVVPTSTNTVSLRDTAVFGQKILKVQRVWVNSSELIEVPQSSARKISTTYNTDAAGQPGYYFTQPPHHLVLVPKSTAAYTNLNWVSAWYLHAALAADADATAISIPPEFHETAAIYCALQILLPRASGASLVRLGVLQSKIAPEMQRCRSRAEDLLNVTSTKRRRNPVHCLG